MRTNHPGSAAVNFTASNLTLLGFALVIGHLCGKRVRVAKTKFARRSETACFTASLTVRYSRGRRFAFRSRRRALSRLRRSGQLSARYFSRLKFECSQRVLSRKRLFSGQFKRTILSVTTGLRKSSERRWTHHPGGKIDPLVLCPVMFVIILSGFFRQDLISEAFLCG
jgi:hypothetical protein